MESEHIDILAAMVPSKTVRQYILETGWTFTDMERAALLHHSDLPLEQKDSCLRDLQAKTEDEDLRKQLSEYLSRAVPFNEERGGWTDGSPMDKLLLCASDLYRGKGSLDELYFFTMGYRKDREQH